MSGIARTDLAAAQADAWWHVPAAAWSDTSEALGVHQLDGIRRCIGQD